MQSKGQQKHPRRFCTGKSPSAPTFSAFPYRIAYRWGTFRGAVPMPPTSTHSPIDEITFPRGRILWPLPFSLTLRNRAPGLHLAPHTSTPPPTQPPPSSPMYMFFNFLETDFLTCYWRQVGRGGRMGALFERSFFANFCKKRLLRNCFDKYSRQSGVEFLCGKRGINLPVSRAALRAGHCEAAESSIVPKTPALPRMGWWRRWKETLTHVHFLLPGKWA